LSKHLADFENLSSISRDDIFKKPSNLNENSVIQVDESNSDDRVLRILKKYSGVKIIDEEKSPNKF